MSSSYYAVKKGFQPGIYTSWAETQKQVNGFKGAFFKRFKTYSEAVAFVDGKPSGKPSEHVDITKFFPIENHVQTKSDEANKHHELLNTIVCFTDGSCFYNGTPYAKAAYSVVWPDYPQHNRAQTIIPATNNRAEYSGVIEAIKIANASIDPDKKLTLIVYTDSLFLIKSITTWLPKWKKNHYKKSDGNEVANLDLVKELEHLIITRNVIFRHVRAHTGSCAWESSYNDQADQLAREAVNYTP